jgi:hypothetical protein
MASDFYRHDYILCDSLSALPDRLRTADILLRTKAEIRRKSTAIFTDCSDWSDWSAPVTARNRQGLRLTGFSLRTLPSSLSPSSDPPLSSRPPAPEPPPAEWPALRFLEMQKVIAALIFALVVRAQDSSDERSVPADNSGSRSALLGSRPQIWLFGDSITVVFMNIRQLKIHTCLTSSSGIWSKSKWLGYSLSGALRSPVRFVLKPKIVRGLERVRL